MKEDGIGQPTGKAKQCPCRTREVGGMSGSGRRAGMCFGMAAASLLLEDLEEGLSHWEWEKRRIDKVTDAGTEVKSEGVSNRFYRKELDWGESPGKSVKLEKNKRIEDALGRPGTYNFHYFNRDYQETGIPVVSSTGSALGMKNRYLSGKELKSSGRGLGFWGRIGCYMQQWQANSSSL